MELNSSLAIRNNKVYEPLKGKNANSVNVDLGNIANLNKIFVRLTVKTAPSNRIDISCRGNRSVDAEDRMPLKVNGVDQNFNLVSINEVGTYNMELDCALFQSGILVFQVGGTVNPMDFDAYISVCRVVVSGSFVAGDTSQYAPVSNKLKTTFAGLNNRVLATGQARTLVIEAKTLVDPPTTAPFAEIVVSDVNRNAQLAAYDKRTGAALHPYSRTGVNGDYVRVTDAGTHYFYYDVSESTEVRISFNSTLLSLKQTFIEDGVSFPDTTAPIEPVVYKGRSFDLTKTSKKVSDCYKNVFVFDQEEDRFKIGYNGYGGSNDLVLLNSSNFPNLIAGSKVFQVYVLPTRTSLVRVCVMTDKGQVYHNYPHRSTTGHGSVVPGDHLRFDESCVWDLPTNATARRHPSNDPGESREGYRYFPYLPDYSYALKPAENHDNGYGNGGFPAQLDNGAFVRPRFYRFKEPAPGVDNPFSIIKGGLTKKPKMSAFGVYQLSGSRVCLFGTEDGGRTWSALYEFDSYVSPGNAIDTTDIGVYTGSSFAFQKRTSVRPTAENKEPDPVFTFGGDVVIQAISNASPAVVSTSAPHGLSNMDLIRLKRVSSGSSGWEHMLNESADPADPNAGNGIFFRVIKLTDTTFELYENLYSPSNFLSCRHIHYTHPLKDFIAFGTGETYPQGWVMLLDDRIIDGSAYVELDKNNPRAWRLNSSTISAQRLCSFWMLDDDGVNPTVYLGSDNMGSFRGTLEIEGRTDLPSRSSTGILKGKLADIDDLSKFRSVFDIPEPNIYCMNLNGVLVAGFQLGSNAISLDNGETWEYLRVGSMLNIAWVDDTNSVYFKEGYRLRIKP